MSMSRNERNGKEKGLSIFLLSMNNSENWKTDSAIVSPFPRQSQVLSSPFSSAYVLGSLYCTIWTQIRLLPAPRSSLIGVHSVCFHDNALEFEVADDIIGGIRIIWTSSK